MTGELRSSKVLVDDCLSDGGSERAEASVATPRKLHANHQALVVKDFIKHNFSCNLEALQLPYICPLSHQTLHCGYGSYNVRR